MRILLLEDNPADAELIEHELREALSGFVLKRVETEEDFSKELLESPPDLILSDYDLPRYNGALALAESRKLCPDVPFVLVTGAVTEDRAIEILTSGAKDYVLKNRLHRLVSAVQRALAEAEEHQARKKAEAELRESHRTMEERIKIRNAELEAEMEERRKTQEALQDSEKRYRRLFESAKDGILILDANTGKVVDVNPFLLQLLGYSYDALCGKHIWEIGVFKDIVASKDAFKALQENEYIRYDDLPLETLDGHSIAVEFISNVYLVDHCKVIQCNIRDITERKRTEEALRENQSRLEMVFAAIPDVILEYDTDGRPVRANAAALKTAGFTDLNFTRDQAAEKLKFANLDGSPVRAEDLPIPRALRGERVAGDPYSIMTAEGNERVILAHATPFCKDGKVNGVVALWHDITEMKKAEKALRESEKQFHALADSIPNLAWWANGDGYITWYNQRWYEYTGTTPEQMEGWGWQSVHDPKLLPKVLERWKASIATGQPFDMEFPLRGADGVFRPFLTRVLPLKDSTGEVLRWFGTNTDISALKQAEETLRESEERHRLLAETMLQGVVHQDANGEIIAMNPAAERILGKNREEFLGGSSVQEEHQAIREDGERFPGMEHPSMVALWTGQPLHDVIMGVFNPKLGDYRWISIDAVPVFRRGESHPSEVYTVFTDITERKRVEEALRRSEEWYRTLFDTLIEGFCIIEVFFDAEDRPIDYRFLEINPAFEKQTGLHYAQGKLMRSLAPDNEAHWFEIYGKIAVTGEPARFENEAKVLNRWYEVSAFRVGGSESRKVAILFNDITERKKAEAELRQQREWLQVTLSSISDAVISTDATGRITFMNAVAEALTGWSLHEVSDRPVTEVFNIINEHTRQGVESPVTRVLKEGVIVGLANHTILVRRDGTEVPIDDSGAPIRSADGKTLGVVLVFRDIIERKQAEDALRNSERLYRAIGESIDYGVWVCEPDGRNIYASESFLKLVGLTQEQCSNFGWGAVLHPDDAERTIEAWKECIRTGSFWDIEHRFRGVDGQWHPVLARGVPVRNERGEIVCWAGINLDISNLKRAEAETAHLASFPMLSPDPIIEVDLAGVIHFCSPAAERIFPDLCQREREHPLLADWETLARSFFEGGSKESTREMKVEGRWYQERMYFVGETKRIRIYVHDITLRKEAEEKLVERAAQVEDANKELESFSYSVSHDLQAPLRAIKGFSEMILKDEAGAGADTKRKLAVIHENAGRMQRLIDDLLALSRVGRQSMAPGTINMDALVKDVWRELEAAYPEKPLTLKTRGLRPAYGDQTLIRQVLINLLSNAIKFSANGKSTAVEVGSYQENSGNVYHVKDQGVGFDMKYYDKLFGVFQRLHSASEFEGTGIGLSIAQRIVHLHGGRIWAEGEVDKGAAFYFQLPGERNRPKRSKLKLP